MEVLVRLSDTVGQALSELSDKTGRPADELIADAVREYLDESDDLTPRSFGMYTDPDLSGADSEDWLRENWRPR